MTAAEEPDSPLLRVVRGDPTAEELAALVAVLSARADSTGRAAGPAAPQSAWAAPRLRTRRPLHPRPDEWRRSALLR
ncbi:MAG: acyl-CoA carboxylase subunit epsilon [Nocardioidaceae bacterium]